MMRPLRKTQTPSQKHKNQKKVIFFQKCSGKTEEGVISHTTKQISSKFSLNIFPQCSNLHGISPTLRSHLLFLKRIPNFPQSFSITHLTALS